MDHPGEDAEPGAPSETYGASLPERGGPDWRPYNASELMPDVVHAMWAARSHGRSFLHTVGRFVRMVGYDLGEGKAHTDGVPSCLTGPARKAEKAAVTLAATLEELDEHSCERCSYWKEFLVGEGSKETLWTLSP